jgi:type II secretion system protein N
MLGKNKKWFSYLLFGVVVTLALLYYRFPSEAVQDYLQAKVERANPALDLSIRDVSPSLTFGLKLLQTQLSRKGSPDRVLFNAERLLLRPSIWAMLQGKRKFCFDGTAYDGALKGCLDFRENGSASPLDASIALKDIRIDKHEDLRGLIGRDIKGTLGGTLTYSGKNGMPIDGTGEADLRLSDGQVQLLQPILSLDTVDFDEVLIKLMLKNRRINLIRVELKGQNMRGTISGTIGLRRELFRSTLDLKGTIEPFADFFKSLGGTRDTVKLFSQRLKRGTLTFVIRGTLKDPRIKFT